MRPAAKSLPLSPTRSLKLHYHLTDLPEWPRMSNPDEFLGAVGVCTIPCVPLRAQPSDVAEMEGQLLFGDLFTVLEAQGGCLKVRRDMRDPAAAQWGSMSGWLDNHLVPGMILSPQEHRRLLFEATWAFVASPTAVAASSDPRGMTSPLPAGCRLPDYSATDGRRSFVICGIRYELPNSSATVISIPAAPTISNLLAVLAAFEGAPYLWGGQTSWGVDCSGLTQSVLRSFGVEIPRNSSEQAKVGEAVSMRDARTGDLAFFGLKNREKPGHVGFIMRGIDGTTALFHAKQRVKCQALERVDDNPEDLMYPESAAAAELKAVRSVLRLENDI